MEEITMWEDIKNNYKYDTWKPTEKDFNDFIKEMEDECSYYEREKFINYQEDITKLKNEVQEFKLADFDKKVKLIRQHIYCYAEFVPVECFTPLWRRVLGMEIAK